MKVIERRGPARRIARSSDARTAGPSRCSFTAGLPPASRSDSTEITGDPPGREYNHPMRNVHPTAHVEKGAVIHPTARVWHFCHVRDGAVLKDHVSLGRDV